LEYAGDIDMALESLPEVLAQLREQLIQAQAAGEGQDLQFKVQDIEVELQVATTLEGNGKIGFKVWLLEGEGGGSMSRENTHTLRLRLEPKRSQGGDVTVSGRRGSSPQ
jgi:hypothetical protein